MVHSASRRLALSAAVFAAAGALALAIPTSRPAEAQTISQYDMCMLNAYYDCYPLDAYGLPRPPNLSDIEEAAQFEQCVVQSSIRCSGLPGDPN